MIIYVVVLFFVGMSYFWSGWLIWVILIIFIGFVGNLGVFDEVSFILKGRIVLVLMVFVIFVIIVILRLFWMV